MFGLTYAFEPTKTEAKIIVKSKDFSYCKYTLCVRACAFVCMCVYIYIYVNII